MVAPAQRAERAADAVGVFQLSGTSQLLHQGGAGITLGHRGIAHVAPRGHVRKDVGVEGVEVDVTHPAEPHHPHAAADVDPHDVGNHLRAQVARKADNASRAGMHVGHHADFASGERLHSDQDAQLLHSRLLDPVGENLHVISFKFNHTVCFTHKVSQSPAQLMEFD